MQLNASPLHFFLYKDTIFLFFNFKYVQKMVGVADWKNTGAAENIVIIISKLQATIFNKKQSLKLSMFAFKP